jgi:hypothetical protein
MRLSRMGQGAAGVAAVERSAEIATKHGNARSIFPSMGLLASAKFIAGDQASTSTFAIVISFSMAAIMYERVDDLDGDAGCGRDAWALMAGIADAPAETAVKRS